MTTSNPSNKKNGKNGKSGKSGKSGTAAGKTAKRKAPPSLPFLRSYGNLSEDEILAEGNFLWGASKECGLFSLKDGERALLRLRYSLEDRRRLMEAYQRLFRRRPRYLTLSPVAPALGKILGLESAANLVHVENQNVCTGTLSGVLSLTSLTTAMNDKVETTMEAIVRDPAVPFEEQNDTQALWGDVEELRAAPVQKIKKTRKTRQHAASSYQQEIDAATAEQQRLQGLADLVNQKRRELAGRSALKKK